VNAAVAALPQSTAAVPVQQQAAAVPVQRAGPVADDLAPPLQAPGGGADPTAFRATEVVALAQLVLSRNFHGPVRTATAQELLFQARMALAKGESTLASDLASLASRMMAPQGVDGAFRHVAPGPEAMAAEAMQQGGRAAEAMRRGGQVAQAWAAPSATLAQAPAPSGPVVPPAPVAMVPLQGLAPLTLRERGVVLQQPPPGPRSLAPRLITDGTPRGIPRT
jgi:hypothetical protein